jgi:hypothetical protein
VKRTKPVTGKNSPRVTKGQAQQAQAKQKQTITKQWLEQRAAVKERLESLDPTDAPSYDQIRVGWDNLTDLGMNLRQIDSRE